MIIEARVHNLREGHDHKDSQRAEEGVKAAEKGP
jgi:hypothetical protein